MTPEGFFQRYAAALNTQQRSAVLHQQGPALLLAVPGSGKTTVLVTRLAYLVTCCQVDPSQILTVTYTVAATQDMRRRCSQLFGAEFAHSLTFRTINGICAHIIHRYEKTYQRTAFQLLSDERELNHLIRTLYRTISDTYLSEGDIKELCDLVHPKYGIITKIGVAHLATFKTRENIQKTKFELIESLPSDGIGILNADDEWQRNYKIKNNCKIKWIGIDSLDADVRATNININSKGMSFDCYFKDDPNPYRFETKLLGYANIYNILAGIALGKEFGMTVEQLKAGVAKVKPVEHRLELKKNGDITIIDDAYNSNPTGAKMALDVLKLMPGKHIVVTPGMIELGNEEYEKNKEFGKQIAESSDEVILVGAEKTKPIYEGLKEKNYDENKIHVINDVLKAFPLIQTLKEKETYVLLENDLPDIFNEKE